MLSKINDSLKCGLVGGLVMVLAANSAMATTGKGYRIVNTNRNVGIQQVWFAHTGEPDPWKAVTLDGPVAPKSSARVVVTGGSSCFYDIKVQFSDGVVQTFSNVNACRFDRVVAN